MGHYSRSYKNFSNYEWHYSEWSVKIKKISSTFLSLRASIQTVRSKEPNELHVLPIDIGSSVFQPFKWSIIILHSILTAIFVNKPGNILSCLFTCRFLPATKQDGQEESLIGVKTNTDVENISPHQEAWHPCGPRTQGIPIKTLIPQIQGFLNIPR